jgi:hypothetical protein
MKTYVNSVMLAMLLSLPLAVQAQSFDDNEDVPDTVPLDGGLSLLAAGGIAYGAKKWHELKKKTAK